MNLYQNAIHRFNDQINPDVTQQGEVTGLPPVTAADNGKVAKVVSGAWAASNENELPAVTAEDNGKVLKVTEGVWAAGAEATELPAVTASDNGKVLTVANGAWSAQAGGGTKKYQHNIHITYQDDSSTKNSFYTAFSFINNSNTPYNRVSRSVLASALKEAGFVDGSSVSMWCPASGWATNSSSDVIIISGVYSTTDGTGIKIVGVKTSSPALPVSGVLVSMASEIQPLDNVVEL